LDGRFLVGLLLFFVRLREFVAKLRELVAREFILRQQPRVERD